MLFALPSAKRWAGASVLVDFERICGHTECATAIEHGVHIVIVTSDLTEDHFREIADRTLARKVGILAAVREFSLALIGNASVR